MAPPIKDFDLDLIIDLASRGASNRDIAAIIGCDESTIRERYPAILLKTRAERHMMIRDAQNHALKQGNTAMLIWLGKQELKQVDKVLQQSPSGEVTVVIKRPTRAPKV